REGEDHTLLAHRESHPSPVTSDVISAFCTWRRFSASSITIDPGESITASVTLTFRRTGRQGEESPLRVRPILRSADVKCLYPSRTGFSSAQRPKYGIAPQLLA